MQADQSRPRLVVGIVVDQLRTDYIEQLQGYFGEKGFKTLLADGVYMPDVDFKVRPADAASATAMLYTGAYPAFTGVPAASIYDPNLPGNGLRLPLASYTSSLTNDSFSPEHLRLSTIADELAISSNGEANIYSVSADPQQAVAMAGHAGSGAFWINNSSGNWVGTSYYGALPAIVSNRNFRNSLAQRIDTMQWRPAKQIKHSFSRSDRDVFKKFVASPLVNKELTDVAIDLIKSISLSPGSNRTDMINIGYTVAPFKYITTGTGDAELTDAYLRLDKQLARLFEAVDKSVGRDNVLIWVVSSGYYDDAIVEDKRYRLPGGEFSTRKAKSLLNSYLSAKHGSAGYVSAIRDGQIYFDRKAIEAMRLDAESVISDARSFLIKMSGIDDAKTINEIISQDSESSRNLRLSVDPKLCGDIFVSFTPGWSVDYDEQTPVQTKQVRESNPPTPAFLLAPTIAPQRIDTPVEAVSLAPTFSRVLRIRGPNGSRARPVHLGTSL